MSYEFVPEASFLRFVELLPKRKGTMRRARYRCTCGNEKDIRISHVTTGATKSCGCLNIDTEKYAEIGIDETVTELMKTAFVPPGSRLSFLHLTSRVQGYNKFALYRCKCGKEKEIKVSHVKTGLIKSCGCIVVEMMSNRKMPNEHKAKLLKMSTRHGLRKHPLYGIYADVKKRCENPNCPAYKYYGARGVRMCDEWRKDFMTFYNWAISNNWCLGLHLDKDTIPKSLGIPSILYGPDTCSFITQKENMNAMRSNTNFQLFGRTQTLSQWAAEFNMNYKLVWGRLRKKWDIQRALTTPLRQKK